MISKRSPPKLRDVKTPLRKMGGRRKIQQRQVCISTQEGRKVAAPMKARRCVGRAGMTARTALRIGMSQWCARSLIMYAASTMDSPPSSNKKKGDEDSQNWERDMGLRKMEKIGVMQETCTTK